jgi:hypothetical protein
MIGMTGGDAQMADGSAANAGHSRVPFISFCTATRPLERIVVRLEI